MDDRLGNLVQSDNRTALGFLPAAAMATKDVPLTVKKSRAWGCCRAIFWISSKPWPFQLKMTVLETLSVAPM